MVLAGGEGGSHGKSGGRQHKVKILARLDGEDLVMDGIRGVKYSETLRCAPHLSVFLEFMSDLTFYLGNKIGFKKNSSKSTETSQGEYKNTHKSFTLLPRG